MLARLLSQVSRMFFFDIFCTNHANICPGLRICTAQHAESTLTCQAVQPVQATAGEEPNPMCSQCAREKLRICRNISTYYSNISTYCFINLHSRSTVFINNSWSSWVREHLRWLYVFLHVTCGLALFIQRLRMIQAFEDLNPAESLSVELCSPQRCLCRIRFFSWVLCRFWQDIASAVECGFLVGLKECPQYFWGSRRTLQGSCSSLTRHLHSRRWCRLDNTEAKASYAIMESWMSQIHEEFSRFSSSHSQSSRRVCAC